MSFSFNRVFLQTEVNNETCIYDLDSAASPLTASASGYHRRRHSGSPLSKLQPPLFPEERSAKNYKVLKSLQVAAPFRTPSPAAGLPGGLSIISLRQARLRVWRLKTRRARLRLP